MRKSITEQKTDKAKMKSSTLKRAKKLEKIAVSKKNNVLLNKVEKIRNCCSVLGKQENKKTKNEFLSGRYCGYYRYCEICASKRKQQKALAVYKYVNANKKLFSGKHFYYIVLTLDRRKHCNLSYWLKEWLFYRDKIAKKYQNSIRKGHKNKSFFHWDGMLISVEIAYDKKQWRNHHMNIVLCTDEDIPISTWIDDWKLISTNNTLFDEWSDISTVCKDHSVVYIKKIKWVTGLKKVVSYINKFPVGIDDNLNWYVSAMENEKTKYKLWSTYWIFQGCFKKKKVLSKHTRYMWKKYTFDSKKEAYI